MIQVLLNLYMVYISDQLGNVFTSRPRLFLAFPAPNIDVLDRGKALFLCAARLGSVLSFSITDTDRLATAPLIPTEAIVEPIPVEAAVEARSNPVGLELIGLAWAVYKS